MSKQAKHPAILIVHAFNSVGFYINVFYYIGTFSYLVKLCVVRYLIVELSGALRYFVNKKGYLN